MAAEVQIALTMTLQTLGFVEAGGEFESICMTCLLSVGICPSEDELEPRENEHVCKGRDERIGLLKSQTATPLKLLVGWVWDQLIATRPLAEANPELLVRRHKRNFAAGIRKLARGLAALITNYKTVSA